MLLVVAPLASCHQRWAHEQAIRNQANAQIDTANADAAREKRYESCEEPHPPDAHCGLISPAFFNPARLDLFDQERCVGLSAEACRSALIHEWLVRLKERYPRANEDRIAAVCETSETACQDASDVERLWLASHNGAVEGRRQALNKVAAADADAELEAERQARLRAFGTTMQAGGQPLSGGTASGPRMNDEERQSRACTSDYSCPGGWHCMKDSNAMSGICAQGVNRVGVPMYSPPDPGSVRPGTGQCSFDTECPVGFRCVKTSGGMRGNCMR